MTQTDSTDSPTSWREVLVRETVLSAANSLVEADAEAHSSARHATRIHLSAPRPALRGTTPSSATDHNSPPSTPTPPPPPPPKIKCVETTTAFFLATTTSMCVWHQTLPAPRHNNLYVCVATCSSPQQPLCVCGTCYSIPRHNQS